MRYALINADGMVENVIEWSGDGEWSPPDGLVAVTTDIADIGWIFSEGEFQPPSIVIHPDELIAQAETEKSARIENAKQHISLWQTQLQLGMISDTDKASLIAWMNYITALQAVDTSTAPEIDWPTPPDA
ncbi:tail fiber assembly protein [Plesiomonas sp. ZOR0011]|uniref:tail fiber assembly protein n=1 Tax=Plesiomonas sp. ZOR0011 TaxID=1339230 RepID=UPI0006479417|nr:tail fiber assembly protein [Plesiomonas sp. ZOR0011]